MEEASAGAVGLDPFAVEDELRDGALADVGDDLVGGAGGGLDVDLFVGDGVRGEEALGLAAVAAPGGGVEDEFHGSILRVACGRDLRCISVMSQLKQLLLAHEGYSAWATRQVIDSLRRLRCEQLDERDGRMLHSSMLQTRRISRCRNGWLRRSSCRWSWRDRRTDALTVVRIGSSLGRESAKIQPLLIGPESEQMVMR